MWTSKFRQINKYKKFPNVSHDFICSTIISVFFFLLVSDILWTISYHKERRAFKCFLLCNVIEIILRYGCYTVNLLHIFRTRFYKNTSGELFLLFQLIITRSTQWEMFLKIHSPQLPLKFQKKWLKLNSVADNTKLIQIIRIRSSCYTARRQLC